MILVIAEQRGGKLNRATWETIAAAQQLASGQPIAVALAGSGVGSVAQELSTAQVKEIVTIEDAALEPYTPDGFVMQFVMRGIVTANGKPFEMQNCIVVSMIDGKVTRIDEYVDPTVAAQLS